MNAVTAPTAVVDLTALRRNLDIVRQHADGTPLMAVLKADAYGHGAVPVARAVLEAGASSIGVATIDEALELRRAGIDAPLLSWLSTSGYDDAIRHDITMGVSSVRQLDAVAAAARRLGVSARIEVKIDTGMARNGVAPDEWQGFVAALARCAAEGAVEVTGTFTHLAHADEPRHPFLAVQRDRLLAAVAGLRAAGIAPGVVHAANSAAALTRADLRFDRVRPGIALFGCSPIAGEDFGLTPVMTLAAPVALVRRVAAGTGVSYGHTWVAPRNTTLGLIPAGYADGVPRSLSGRFSVQIGERRYPAVGRVCMDQFVVDLGPDGGGVVEGDTAVLFGAGALRATGWAAAAGTIDYEILTGIGRRVGRVVA